MRSILDFNEGWSFRKPGEAPVSVTLPHTWNNRDGQDGGNDYWRGTAVYTKTFPMPEAGAQERVFLEVNGAAMTADVKLNGAQLAHHEGGYAAFRVDLTEGLLPENKLEIAVDNGENDRVYPQRADFTFYGGLYRNVKLLIVPEEHFELQGDGTPGIHVTPRVNLEDDSAAVTVETWQSGGTVEITVDGVTQSVPSVDGYARAEFFMENVRLWDGLRDPYLYTATARLPGGDEVSTRFGCRKIHIDAQKGFFLNGRSYPLRGVSRHQDREGVGSALTEAHHRQDMALLRELGANTVRLAHYQQAQEFYDLCDENGILVWAEIPYITMPLARGRENALTQMRELVTQSYNHPSVFCWGLSNEITSVTEVDEALLASHRLLNDLCHELDPLRATTMAHVFTLKPDSPLAEIPDISSYNLYYGWYQGETGDNARFLDEVHARYPERALGLSEYGADANIRFHSSAPRRGDYTEEYQCLFHEQLLEILEQRPYLWGSYVWNLFDFAADGRDEGGEKGRNLKGLITFDHETKKDAFYLYKAAWSGEPFVHICGRRYARRTESVTRVKVYSNCESVTLLADGVPLETKTGRKIFCFSVPLSGEHRICALSGDSRDEITLCRVAELPEEYCCRDSTVTNWFEKEDMRADCYSVEDSVGDLLENPETNAIVMGIFRKKADGGKAVSPAMLQMIGGLSLSNVLKRSQTGAVTEEQLSAINKLLQKVHKTAGND